MPDYIPRTDAEFNEWQNNFMLALNARLDALGVTDAEFTSLDTAKGRWENAHGAHMQAQAMAAAATHEKQQAREEYVQRMRAIIARLQMQPSMNDNDRIALGISLRATERTPAPVPATQPLVQVETGQRLRHTINYSDEATPNRRAKPEGVRACEIWVKVGDPPPADPSELRLIALSTHTPYVAQYNGADTGKVAHYMLRWVNSRDEKGPWSQTVSATIPG